MTHALNRLTAALTGWIPDISGIPMRRQLGLGVAISLLINFLVILIVALIFDKPVAKPVVAFAKPKLRARSIELVITPPEPELEPLVPFTLEPKPEQPFIDSRGLDIAREAALNPIFQ